jgi:hypothetical protein
MRWQRFPFISLLQQRVVLNIVAVKRLNNRTESNMFSVPRKLTPIPVDGKFAKTIEELV